MLHITVDELRPALPASKEVRMKVAAYQAPLLPSGCWEALELIRGRVKWCETEGVDILCCPEACSGDLQTMRNALPASQSTLKAVS
jgi:predicted amidohydrolase